jgi:hypothetical protein
MTPSAGKHIDLIQATVTRMATNSFLLKAWSVTLISAIFALAAKDANKHFAALAFFPAAVFWVLDAHYLSQERLYRALYDHARKSLESESDLSMSTESFAGGKNAWMEAVTAKTLLIFYGGILATISIATFVL